MIEAAIQFIDPTDRDKWVMAAMAVKSELGDGGFDLWDSWSAQASNYKAADAKAVWRSVKSSGGITIASLYAEARKGGYNGEEVKPTVRPRDRDRERREREDKARKWQYAATQADLMIRSAELGSHEYLIRKGFEGAPGFVLDDQLLIPMRCAWNDQLNSLQIISRDGSKKFLPGGRAKGSVFRLGKSGQAILCEGYATGLSIKEALRVLYRSDSVVVCFSASNLTYVSQRLGDFVVADNDASETGEKAALKTGLPYWMPPDVGQDANDFHKKMGIHALAASLRDLMNGGIKRQA